MKWPPQQSQKRQRGVALISVMLVFALISVLAAELLGSHFRDIRRSAGLIDSRQAYFYALGAEQYARQLLYRDYQRSGDKPLDTLDDEWARPLSLFEIEQGQMQIAIVDAQGLFDLNSLTDEQGRIDQQAVVQFAALLEALELEPKLAAQLRDWLDADQQLSPDGAEDADYLASEAGAPYLTAAAMLADKSELMALRDMRLDTYRVLEPYVTALPKRATYNLNTLDATIIRALSEVSRSAAAIDTGRISSRQAAGGYTSLQDWLQAEGRALQPLSSVLGVSSEYFELHIEVSYAKRRVQLRSLLKRSAEDGRIQVLSRQLGRFQPLAQTGQ